MPRPLTKQDLLRFCAHLAPQFVADGKPTFDRRSGLHGFEPALEMGELVEILAQPLIRDNPRPALRRLW